MQGLGTLSGSAHAFTGLPCSTRSASISNSNNSNSCSTCIYKYMNTPFLTQVRHSEKAFISLPGRRRLSVTVRASSEAMEKLGVKIQRNPPESKLSELGIKQWPKWGCPPSKFPWTYSSTETCYLLKGKVKVTPDGANEAIEIGAGDLVVFPKGMSCTWDVSETVDKHYKFD